MKIKKIEWSDVKCPNEENPYHHVIGKTPLGDFLITWKGWKESISYDIEHEFYSAHVCGFSSFFSLEEAKEQAKNAYEIKVSECIEMCVLKPNTFFGEKNE